MVHGFLEYLAENIQNIGPELAERVVKPLSEFGEGRLQIMDGNGSSFQASELHNLQVASSRHISYLGDSRDFNVGDLGNLNQRPMDMRSKNFKTSKIHIALLKIMMFDFVLP